jgi:fused signal recognition particle receptor
MGLFEKLRVGLAKTRESLVGNIARLVGGKNRIDAEMFDRLEEILLSSDVGVETTRRMIENMKRRVKEEQYESPAQLLAVLKAETVNALQVNGSDAVREGPFPVRSKPHVIMVVGVNGVGKTTSIAKLAHQYIRRGRKVLIGAADTFRAAANEQLKIWADRVGSDLIQQPQGADPASVAFDTVSSALARGVDVVIIDTAGRLHTRTNLMEELKKIKRVIQKRLTGAPHEVLLVVDALTGQNALQQARLFHEAVGVTGLVLTKLDGTAKGGIVLAISSALNIPVQYVGVGEAVDDLQPFEKEIFVEALFEGLSANV